MLVKLIQRCCFHFTGDSNRPYANEVDHSENMQNDHSLGHGSASVYGPNDHGDPFKTVFTNPFIQFLLLVKLIQHCCFNFTGDSNCLYAYEENYSENMNNEPAVRHSSASVNDSIGHGHRDPFKTNFTDPFIQFLLLEKNNSAMLFFISQEIPTVFTTMKRITVKT